MIQRQGSGKQIWAARTQDRRRLRRPTHLDWIAGVILSLFISNVHHMKWRLGTVRWISPVMMIAVVSFSAVAQQDPKVFISAGKGLFCAAGATLWSLERNVNMSAGYSLTSNVMAIGNFDYDTYSFHGPHSYDSHSAGYFHMSSLFVGVKYSRPTPRRIISPYMEGLVGVSVARPKQDSVFYFHWPDIVVSRGVSGTTATIAGAIGVDIFVYKGFLAFVEGRMSQGLKPKVSPIVLMLRAGVGIAFY